ncbi:NUDIX hydrolase [Ruegeria conchae]|uniref:NUDIX hydrolase n=1 Tax=Ruegeria conchae TaxID=981384 RepID=UPI0021A4AACA|nr:NUDIX hydrolase [Ruegeria conchae]UWR02127.1 NUDIX hydrolase [Ruegeria conchae]
MRQNPTAMEDIWLTRAKRLLALAETGQHFTKDPFERERYDEIASMACEMLADLGRVPLAHIDGLITEHSGGYATPSVDVRGAIIRNDRILLVRERRDGRWTMPGGYADIGSSPAENIEREVWEEAGLRVKADRIFALRHKARHPYPPSPKDFYKIFFLCTQIDEADPASGLETDDVDYFAEGALPQLSLNRVISADITEAFKAHRNKTQQAIFD